MGLDVTTKSIGEYKMQIRGAGGTEFQVLGAATPKLAVPNVLCMMFTRKRRYDPS